MIGAVTLESGSPGVPHWVTLSAEKSNFAMPTFQGEVTQASRGRFRDTSNSPKIHFGVGWLHIIIKGRKPQH